MKAISVRQPWAWAILRAGKRCENREWKPDSGNLAQARRLIGSTIAIHTGKGCTRDEYASAAMFMLDRRLAFFEGSRKAKEEPGVVVLPKLDRLPRGAIVGTARLVTVVVNMANRHRCRTRGIGSDGCLLCNQDAYTGPPGNCPYPDAWAIPDAFGLILDDVVALAEPIPFKGALGFFDVPEPPR